MRRNLDALTSLRFFAALAIVVQHMRENFKVTSNIGPHIPYSYGVSFFFVLSGFILTYVYQEMSRPGAIHDFYVARIAKIWPLHVATFALAVMVYPWPQLAWGHNIILVGMMNLLLLHAWIPIPAVYFSFNSVSWSISTEFFFYLLFPLLVINWRKTWYWKSTLIFLWVAAILTFSDFLHIPPYDPSHLGHITNHGIAYIGPFTRIAEFVLGMLAAGLFITVNTGKPRNSIFLWTMAEIAAIAVAWYCGTHATNFLNWIAGRNMATSAWGTYVTFCGAAPGFAVLITVFAQQSGLISKILAIRPLVILGEASFAIYLEHQIVLGWFIHHQNRLAALSDRLQCVLYFGIVLILALILWTVVEKPCRSFIRKAFSQRVLTRVVEDTLISPS